MGLDKTVILLVDDEKNVLKALNRSMFDYPYEVKQVSSSAEAKEYLSANRADLIISDYKMPDENGFELLSFVRDNYPDVIRIMLSGYLEKEVILKSLFSCVALAYFPKPWDNEKLLNRINELMEIKRSIDNKSLWIKLNNGFLFNISSLASNNLALLDRENPDRDQLYKIIFNDVSIFFRIAIVMYSDYFRTPLEFNLEEAISLVGANNILKLTKEIPEVSAPCLYSVIPDIFLLHYNDVFKSINGSGKIESVDFPLPFIYLYNYLLSVVDEELYHNQIKLMVENGTPIQFYNNIREVFKTLLHLCKLPSLFIKYCDKFETDESEEISIARKLRDLIELFWWSDSMPEKHPFFTIPIEILENIYEDVQSFRKSQL